MKTYPPKHRCGVYYRAYYDGGRGPEFNLIFLNPFTALGYDAAGAPFRLKLTHEPGMPKSYRDQYGMLLTILGEA